MPEKSESDRFQLRIYNAYYCADALIPTFYKRAIATLNLSSDTKSYTVAKF